MESVYKTLGVEDLIQEGGDAAIAACKQLGVISDEECVSVFESAKKAVRYEFCRLQTHVICAACGSDP